MAITQTGAIYKAFSFDNVSSRDFGVYITSEAVYNAPERDVEMISIPGRNGAFALDKGRFENIEVKYPAGIFADNETDFAHAVSDLRNYLCSKKGYLRLTDEYNPDEYRMAVYKSGLEVSPVQLRAGEFEIIFECKPQRWLISGDTAITVTNNGTLTNPTLFEASPMLEVKGYGNIGINGETVTVQNAQLGEIKISDSATTSSVSLTVDNLNAGDSIIKKTNLEPYVDVVISFPSGSTNSCEASMRSTGTGGTVTVSRMTTNSYRIRMIPTLTGFVNGTSSTATAEALISIQPSSTSYSKVLTVEVAYNASTNSITLTSNFDSAWPSGFSYRYEYKHPTYYGISSKNILPSPMYIDLDIGDAYGIVDGAPLSFNNVVQIPADLPTLKAGSNTITYDNTVTDLKVIPRWWKI